MFNINSENAVTSSDFFAFKPVDKISKELDDLETSYAKELSVKQPVLFGLISEMVRKITVNIPWTVAQITVIFHDVSSEYVQAFFLSNGSLQLKLGASCIRAYLVEPLKKDANKKQQAFSILVEQELQCIRCEGFKRAKLELSMLDGKKPLREFPVLLQMLRGFVAMVKNEIGCSEEFFSITIGRVSPSEAVGVVINKEGVSLFLFGKLINQLLFDQRPEYAEKNYLFFKWFIAHALGQFEDPLFRLNSRYPEAKGLLLALAGYFSLGLIEKISQPDRILIYLYYLLYLDLWMLSSIVFLFLTAALGIIYMQRRMTFRADAYACRVTGIEFEDAQELLKLAYGESKQEFFSYFTRDKIPYCDENGNVLKKRPRFFAAQREWLFLKICAIGMYVYLFHNYPSVEKRIRQLKKMYHLAGQGLSS